MFHRVQKRKIANRNHKQSMRRKPCTEKASGVWSYVWHWYLDCFLTQAQAADKPKDYPNKPVTIQIGFGAGGSSDVGVRILAESLKKIIGQPVLAENKAGGRGPGDVDRLQEQRQARRLYAGADQRPAAADRRLRPGAQVPLHHERLPARGKSRAGSGRHPGQEREPLQDAGGPAQRREGTAGPGERLHHGDRERRPSGGFGRRAPGESQVQHHPSEGHPDGPHPGPGRSHRCEFRQHRRLPADGRVRPGPDPGGDDGAALPGSAERADVQGEGLRPRLLLHARIRVSGREPRWRS